ncbi:hypothetical protein, partial [Burkholderia pseudomallei]|uniref:hypothetical protein n=1 Tax=Burkholderia pseudomallei TaxID=28450 RepID=UPI001E61A25F|nr:hypothetical protein [Burkholderia pseudomallei]
MAKALAPQRVASAGGRAQFVAVSSRGADCIAPAVAVAFVAAAAAVAGDAAGASGAVRAVSA